MNIASLYDIQMGQMSPGVRVDESNGLTNYSISSCSAQVICQC